MCKGQAIQAAQLQEQHATVETDTSCQGGGVTPREPGAQLFIQVPWNATVRPYLLRGTHSELYNFLGDAATWGTVNYFTHYKFYNCRLP